MPYFVDKGSQGAIETYKTEKCRTCDQRHFTCPMRSHLFTNRGLKVKVLVCPAYVERPKEKGARVAI